MADGLQSQSHMRRLLLSSAFAFPLLWAIAVHAQATSEGSLFSATAPRQWTAGLKREVPVTLKFEKAQKEDFWPVDGEEVLGTVRWLELMRWNYIGQEPRQFCRYGAMARDLFAVFANDSSDNSAGSARIFMSAVQAFKKQSAALIKVQAEKTELRLRIDSRRRIGLSIQLLFD